MTDKIANFMFERTGIEKVGKYLDVSSFKQKLIAGNIANVSTPGFRAQDIDFQAEFERATAPDSGFVGYVTHPNHVPIGNNPDQPPKVIQTKPADGDLNAVDADKEIANLAQNELKYSIGATLLKRRIDGLRKAITSE